MILSVHHLLAFLNTEESIDCSKGLVCNQERWTILIELGRCTRLGARMVRRAVLPVQYRVDIVYLCGSVSKDTL
jgi:hypothetical protein